MDIFNAHIWLVVFCMLSVAVIGALLHTWRQRRNLLIRQLIPANWPMKHRQPVTAQECQVWQWLCATFPAHRVSLKMPITRFTQPLRPTQGPGLYKMLASVYCTFTVCSPEGHVMGCADVSGSYAAVSKLLKQAVLTRCGIAYAVLDAADLPSAVAIRSKFLGEKSARPVAQSALPAKSREEHRRELEDALLADARARLSTALDRQRRIRYSEFSPLMADPGKPAPARWQPNSFLAPLAERSSAQGLGPTRH